MNIFKRVYDHYDLKPSDLEKIIDKHELHTYKEGEKLISLYSKPEHYWVLQEGTCRSYLIDHKGEEITTGFFTSGDITIEIGGFFTNTPAQENIIALSDCLAWKISFVDFQLLFLEMEAFRDWGRSWMVQCLINEKRKALSFHTQTAEDRYVDLLKEKPEIIQKAPLKYIASYLGMKDATLSRLRKKLSTKNN